MNRIAICMFVMISWAAIANTPPRIENITAAQRTGTKLVDIYYDAIDPDGDPLLVSLFISDNDGETFYIPCASLTGDVGTNVVPGVSRHIVWDAGKDWNGEYSDRMRVKISAIDRKGCPGMEFGTEVQAGGFWFGCDELSAEGSGPGKHISIPWNYWLGKYEVTVGQYCEYLNWALAAGHITKTGKIMPSMEFRGLLNGASELNIPKGISWKLNKFSVVDNATNRPAVVNWYGAMAFARFYGYDLPTEAEWERAARGPDHEDIGNHLVFPWGDKWLDNCAFAPMQQYWDSNKFPLSKTKDVGSYMDIFEGAYGLCDMIGNVSEWTRSDSQMAVENYPNEETIEHSHLIVSTGQVVCKGVDDNGIAYRLAVEKSCPWYCYAKSVNYYGGCGFRVCRRPAGIVDDAEGEGGNTSSEDDNTGTGGSAGTVRRSTGVITFEDWPIRANNQFGYIESNGYSWGLGAAWECMYTTEFAYSGTKCIYSYNGGSATGAGGFFSFVLPVVPGKIIEVRLMAGNFGAYERNLALSTSVDGKSYADVSKKVPPGGYTRLTFVPVLFGRYGEIKFSGGVYVDDVEVIYETTN